MEDITLGKRKKNRLPRKEAKIKAREKRIRRAFRVSRLRGLKNFCFWLGGVLSSFGIIFGAIFLGVGVLPISTLLGEDAVSEYVSSNVYDKSLLDAIIGIEDFTFDDFPILEKTLKEAMGVEGDDFILSSYQKVDLPKIQLVDTRYEFVSGMGIASDYYYVAPPVATAPLNTETLEVKYERAFDDNGYMVETLNEKYLNGELELYFPPLFEMSLVEGFSAMGRYINLFQINDLLKLALGDSYEDGSLLAKAFAGMTVGNLTQDQGDEDGFGDKVMSNLSLDALGISEFGDFDGQKFFSEFEKVPEDKYPLTEVDSITGKETITMEDDSFTSNPKMFYVQLTASAPAPASEPATDGDAAPAPANCEYARAFNNDGQFITEYVMADGTKLTFNSLSEVKTANLLCYANLSEISLIDTFDLMDESIDRMAISELALGDYEDNEKMFDMLLSASGKMPEKEEGMSDEDYKALKKTAAEALTMEEFDNLDMDTVKLTVLLGDYEESEKLYDIIMCDQGTLPEREDMNDEEYKLLKKAAAEELTLSAIENGINVDSVKLTVVIPHKEAEGSDPGTAKLYNILKDVTGKDNADDILIEDLNSFESDNIKLSTVLEYNDDTKKLYDILCEGVPRAEGEEPLSYLDIKISNLSDFDIEIVKLETVLNEEDIASNNILKALIAKGVTVGSIGTTMNSMTLYDIYGTNCFAEDSTLGGDKFKREVVEEVVEGEVVVKIKYERDDTNGTYYINQKGGIWLVLCFTAEDVDETTGKAGSYTSDSVMTMTKLQDDGDEIGDRLLEAKIYQLVEAGIIKRADLSAEITSKSINGLIDHVQPSA